MESKEKIVGNEIEDMVHIKGVIKINPSSSFEHKHDTSFELPEGGFYFYSDTNGTSKAYKKREIPIERFGELVQAIYDTETHFRIEWLWDGGFDFSYGCMGEYDKHPLLVKEMLEVIDSRLLKDVLPLIVLEYEINHSIVDSNGELNAMGKFIKSLV